MVQLIVGVSYYTLAWRLNVFPTARIFQPRIPHFHKTWLIVRFSFTEKGYARPCDAHYPALPIVGNREFRPKNLSTTVIKPTQVVAVPVQFSVYVCRVVVSYNRVYVSHGAFARAVYCLFASFSFTVFVFVNISPETDKGVEYCL